MDEAQDLKEWVRLSHSPKQTTVTVTLQDGNQTVKWTVKTFSNGIKTGLKEAREGAKKGLRDLQEALAELDEEEEAAA